MNIAIIGKGLVAQTAAALFASVGNRVLLVDALGLEHFPLEPELNGLFEEQVTSGRLTIKRPANEPAFDVVIFAEEKAKGFYAEQANEKNALMNENSISIILSPERIGQTESIQQVVDKLFPGHQIACVPVLVREGRALADFSRPDSLIVGCDTDFAFSVIQQLFYPFNRSRNVMKRVSSVEAEFATFARNAMLATRLSFMNEMASLASQSQVDIEVIRECIGADPRIGKDYLYPGCGYGGKALEENVAQVAKDLADRQDDFGLLKVVQQINEKQKSLLFRKIWRFYQAQLAGKVVAVWGAAFKPGSSSLFGAPALSLIDNLIAQGAQVQVYDPMAKEALQSHYASENVVQVFDSRDAVLKNANLLAICTEWKEFWSPDIPALRASLKDLAIFDGRNLYNPKEMEKHGLTYFAVGRGLTV